MKQGPKDWFSKQNQFEIGRFLFWGLVLLAILALGIIGILILIF